MVHPGGRTAARLMEWRCRRPTWCRSRLLVGGRPRCSRPRRGRPRSTLPHVPAAGRCPGEAVRVSLVARTAAAARSGPTVRASLAARLRRRSWSAVRPSAHPLPAREHNEFDSGEVTSLSSGGSSSAPSAHGRPSVLPARTV
uniref:Uncharacterized protein n=1 Tax=Setaria viridis TaxID=4556 RepID=A0A4U6UY24_SETVI|nr:hypothetical protein SEVIR_5G282000v2 [Setaria viridis]